MTFNSPSDALPEDNDNSPANEIASLPTIFDDSGQYEASLRDEITLFAGLIGSRAQHWHRIVILLHEEYNDISDEEKRAQRLADALTRLAARLAILAVEYYSESE